MGDDDKTIGLDLTTPASSLSAGDLRRILAQFGFTATPTGDKTVIEKFSDRLDWFEISIKNAIDGLSAKALPVLAELHEEMVRHRVLLGAHTTRLEVHGNRLDALDREIDEHGERITKLEKKKRHKRPTKRRGKKKP